MPNHWPSLSVLKLMSVVWNIPIWNMVLLSTFGLLLTCLCLGILYKFGVCMIGKKTTALFICIHKRVKSLVFAVSIKWIGSRDFNNHVFLTKELEEENKNNILIFSVLPVKVKLTCMASGRCGTQLSLKAPPLSSPNRKIILKPITTQTSSVLWHPPYTEKKNPRSPWATSLTWGRFYMFSI